MKRKILSINISAKKGEKKRPVDSATLVVLKGIEGDGHAWSKREVSLLSIESINKMGGSFRPGDFAENLTTEGLELLRLPIGSRLQIGDSAIIEISEIGKICHDKCEIFKKHGRCVMPEEGVFAKVVTGGKIKKGDEIKVVS